MNTAILACQKYLQPDKLAKVTSKDVESKLTNLGWKVGDPVPAGLPAYTKEVLKVLGKASSTKNALAIFELEEVQLTLKSALEHAKQVQNKADLVSEEMKNIAPDLEQVNPAIQDTLKELVEQEAKKKVQKRLEEFHVETSDDEFEDVPVETAKPVEEPVKDVSKVISPICPRCGLDLEHPYKPEPINEEDRNTFLYAALGSGTFEKKYTVLSGLLEVTFRTRTAEEFNLINHQLALDMSAGIITTEAQRLASNYRYNFCVSIKELKINTGNKNKVIPIDWHDERFKTNGSTPLRAFSQYIEQDIVISEFRYTTLATVYDKFIQIYAALLEEAQNPNFWKTLSENA